MPPKKKNNDVIEMMVRELPLPHPPSLQPIIKPKKLQLSMKKKDTTDETINKLGNKLEEVKLKSELQLEINTAADTKINGKKPKVKTVKIVEPKIRCIARRLNNEQCPRARTKDSEFCGAHSKKQSNGTINDPVNIHAPAPTLTRRGRKRKTEFSDKIYNDEYIAMWEHIIENEKYLMDKYGNVYTFNIEHPKLLGKQTLANKIE